MLVQRIDTILNLQISIIIIVVVIIIIVQVGVVDGWRVGREWVPIQNHSLCVTQK